MENCLSCKLNKSKEFLVEMGRYWQVDKPMDINLNGLFFIKTKRHVENLEDLNQEENEELGSLISKYARESKRISGALRVVTWSLGLTIPHIHFWIVPYTNENKEYLKEISIAVKNLADKYR